MRTLSRQLLHPSDDIISLEVEEYFRARLKTQFPLIITTINSNDSQLLYPSCNLHANMPQTTTRSGDNDEVTSLQIIFEFRQSANHCQPSA
jgi:hypothetical protein